ncbi:MAG: hypothetical protein M1839_002403 [Geoglossum umbratile]|nr:MAG: hypothetical protein M1839_002403 [Geoglossum umbratile]
MAPKGGGKGGGSHSSGSSGSGSSGSSAPTNWTRQTTLLGGHFKQPAVVAALAFACLCLAGILAVAVWSFIVKPKGRKVFKWFGLPMAITAATLSMALDVTDRFLHELEVTVPAPYAFINLVSEYFFLKSSVLLLFIVYAVINNRIQCIWKDVSHFRIWKLVHLVFGVALALIFFIDIVIYLTYYIKYFSSPIGTLSYSAFVWLERWRKVNAAFHMLYLVAAVDIMVCAVVIASGARSRRVPSLISKYLLIIIAPLLLLRCLILGVYSINFTLLLNTVTGAADIAYVILCGIPTVIIFAGLVKIATQGDWFPEYQAVHQGNAPPDQHAYAPQALYPAPNAVAAPNVYSGQNVYAAQGAYPVQNVSYGQKLGVTGETQPWVPPPPPPPPPQQQHPYYDTSYQRQI